MLSRPLLGMHLSCFLDFSQCRCHGVGHWASKCPNQGEGGGGYGGGGGGGFAGSRYKADGGGGSTWGGAQGGGGAYGGAAGGKSGACFKVGRPYV